MYVYIYIYILTHSCIILAGQERFVALLFVLGGTVVGTASRHRTQQHKHS